MGHRVSECSIIIPVRRLVGVLINTNGAMISLWSTVVLRYMSLWCLTIHVCVSDPTMGMSMDQSISQCMVSCGASSCCVVVVALFACRRSGRPLVSLRTFRAGCCGCDPLLLSKCLYQQLAPLVHLPVRCLLHNSLFCIRRDVFWLVCANTCVSSCVGVASCA